MKLLDVDLDNIGNATRMTAFTYRADTLLLVDELRKAWAAIRKHRDYRGDDRCVGDNHELYLVLPEGDTRPPHETLVTIENCQKFIACQQEPGRVYVSPQRRIEELEKEVERLGQALTHETRVSLDYAKQRDEWMKRAKQQAAYADASVGVDDQRKQRIAELENEVEMLKKMLSEDV